MVCQTDWFLRKFREWESSTGRHQSEAAWARYLGVKQATLNRWMTGQAVPDRKNMKILAKKISAEIYQIFDVDTPESGNNLNDGKPPYTYSPSPLDNLPGEFGRRLRAAVSEFYSECARLNLDQHSKEADDLLSDILDRLGWKK